MLKNLRKNIKEKLKVYSKYTYRGPTTYILFFITMDHTFERIKLKKYILFFYTKWFYFCYFFSFVIIYYIIFSLYFYGPYFIFA